MDHVTEKSYHPSEVKCRYKGSWEIESGVDIAKRAHCFAFHSGDTGNGSKSFIVEVHNMGTWMDADDELLEFVIRMVESRGGPDKLSNARFPGEMAAITLLLCWKTSSVIESVRCYGKAAL